MKEVITEAITMIQDQAQAAITQMIRCLVIPVMEAVVVVEINYN